MEKFLETSHFNSISTIIRRGLNKIYKVGNENKSLIFVISLTAKKNQRFIIDFHLNILCLREITTYYQNTVTTKF